METNTFKIKYNIGNDGMVACTSDTVLLEKGSTP